MEYVTKSLYDLQKNLKVEFRKKKYKKKIKKMSIKHKRAVNSQK